MGEGEVVERGRQEVAGIARGEVNGSVGKLMMLVVGDEREISIRSVERGPMYIPPS